MERKKLLHEKLFIFPDRHSMKANLSHYCHAIFGQRQRLMYSFRMFGGK